MQQYPTYMDVLVGYITGIDEACHYMLGLGKICCQGNVTI